MRERLFRGKRIDNGEWVYGAYLAHDYDGHTIFNQNLGDGSLQGFEVIPETVGQCTELDDKNNRKIYEGDILNHPVQGKRKVYYPFSERVGSYGLRMIDGEVRMASTLSEGFLYEVIGNIHDNPELTEAKKKIDWEDEA